VLVGTAVGVAVGSGALAQPIRASNSMAIEMRSDAQFIVYLPFQGGVLGGEEGGLYPRALQSWGRGNKVVCLSQLWEGKFLSFFTLAGVFWFTLLPKIVVVLSASFRPG